MVMSPMGLKSRITVLAKTNSNLVESIVIGYGQDGWGCVPVKGTYLFAVVLRLLWSLSKPTMERVPEADLTVA